MPHVEKKYIKLGVVALAVVALVIGLSVGLTQKNKSTNNTSAANASDGLEIASEIDVDVDIDVEAFCSSNSKSGKSGGRRLVVPGTEQYVSGAAAVSQMGKRRKLRKELIRELGELGSDDGATGIMADGLEIMDDATDDTMEYDDDDDFEDETASSDADEVSIDATGSGSGSGSGSRSGKSGKFGTQKSVDVKCTAKVKEICGNNKSVSGKSGKSGGVSVDVIGSKSGGGITPDGSSCGKSGGCVKPSFSFSMDMDRCTCIASGGKSGKSGNVKSGVVGTGTASSRCGKSGKSGSGSGSGDCSKPLTKVCSCSQPSTCSTDSTPPPSPDSSCVCEEQQFYFDGKKCVRVECGETAPSDDVSLFDNSSGCCTNAFGSSAEDNCIVEDVCFTSVPTLSPNEQPDETPAPSSGSSSGSTPTVSTEATAPPTGAPRPKSISTISSSD